MNKFLIEGLKTRYFAVILKLWQHFSDDVVEVITAFISSVCCTNHRNHIHLLSLLVDLLPTLTMLQDKLLFSGNKCMEFICMLLAFSVFGGCTGSFVCNLRKNYI